MASTLDGRDVLAATLTLPISGAWTADVVTSSPLPSAGRCVLTLEGLPFSGTVTRGAAFAGRAEHRIVGGAGGLGTAVTAKHYVRATVRVVLGDLLELAGERLSATVTTDLLDRPVDRWSRLAGTVAQALGQLSATLGVGWRILRDGTLWVGVETWPTFTGATGELLDEGPAEGLRCYAPTRPELTPGTVVGQRRVGHVIHRLTGRELRTEALVQDQATARGAAGALVALVRQLLAPTRYLGRYPGRVVGQGAGRVAFRPDGDEVPGVGGAPVRLGLPGMVVEGITGQRAQLGFERGDPQRPYVSDWEAGGTAHIGTLLFVVLMSVPPAAPAVLSITTTWFPAGATGNAAAQVALVAAQVLAPASYLLPLTVPVLSLSPPP